MKRWVVVIATVGLLLAGDKGASSDAQSPGWLFSNEASLSSRGAQESKGHPKIASRLTQAVGMAALIAQPGPTVPFAESLAAFARFDQQGRIEVYITLDTVSETTLNALRQAGVEIEIYDASQRLVQGWIATSQVQAVADLPSVTFVDLPNYGVTNTGFVTTQGDAVIRADEVRAQGVTGNGVKVGVISDGINGLTSSIASGDLPSAGITMPAAPLTGGGIALDSPLPGAAVFSSTPVGRSDLTTGSEGRALMEIIHDIAPDAQLFFAPGFTTTLGFQRAVRWLVAQGVKVIADDSNFFNVGPYDGTSVVSQEVSNAVTSGVSYFQSVGNYAQQHYRGLFTDTDGDAFHEFDVSLGLPRVDNAGETLNVTVQPGETIIINLQWNDPFGASINDFDLCVNDPPDNPSSHVFCSLNLQTGTQNPTEILVITRSPNAPGPGTLGVSINKFGTAAPRIFDLFIRGGVMNEFVVPQGSVPNKADAGGGVLSVGAVNWQTPNAIEFFSSRGPTSDGRLKPELVAPDGVSTSVFSPFFGTSAAAPHAAGAAALVLSANPALTSTQVGSRLTSGAVPLGSPIPNNTFGFGRVDALQALSASGASAAQAFVTRLYQQVLNRQPDPAGLQAFLDQIQQFGSVVPTVLAFFHSSEFLARNTTNEQLLTILYHTFLNRDPDPAGFNAFLSALQSGQLTRDNLLDIFIDSAEFASQASFLPPLDPVTTFVTTLYVRILGRGPDQAGLQGFVTQLRQTRTVLPTVQQFLASPEFLSRNTTNTEFVTLLYRVFLGRVPDAGGLTFFVNALNQGTATRDQLVLQFAASPEFQAIQQRLFP